MNEELPYRIRRSDRARRVRVSVDAAGAVEVVLPRRSPASAAPAAVAELRPWIERRLRESGAVRAAIAARGATLPYLGTQLALIPEPGRTRAHRRADELLVPGDAERATAAIERWYRRAAATGDRARGSMPPRTRSGRRTPRSRSAASERAGARARRAAR